VITVDEAPTTVIPMGQVRWGDTDPDRTTVYVGRHRSIEMGVRGVRRHVARHAAGTAGWHAVRCPLCGRWAHEGVDLPQHMAARHTGEGGRS